MPLPSLAAIAIRESTFQQGVENTPPPPAMLDQKKPGRIRVKLVDFPDRQDAYSSGLRWHFSRIYYGKCKSQNLAAYVVAW